MQQVKTSQVRNKNGELLFESLSLEEAQRFIKTFHMDYGVILELYETTRMPVDHRKKQIC